MDGILSLKQAETLFASRTLLLGSDGVDVFARDQSVEVDEAICFPCYVMLETFSERVSNNFLYTRRVEWKDLEKFLLHRRALPLVFAALLASVTEGPIITRPWLHQLKLTDFDEDESVVTGPESQSAVTRSYTDQ